MSGKLPFSGLVRLEPRLGALLEEARAVPAERRDWRTYEGLKRRLTRLVGWGVDDPVLGSPAAFEAAIAALIDELGL